MQMRDYDGLISHTTIVMIRYLFLCFEQRLHVDHRSLGSLFHACIDEVKDLSFIESLQRILALVIGKVRNSAVFTERVMFEFIDTVMGVAIEMFNPGNKCIPISTA